MSFPFLALYTGDYLRDTRHLSCCEHGVYLLMLMHCWDSRGPLPLDDKKIMGICAARSKDEVEAMRRVRDGFFTRMDDGYYNRRIQREIERSNAISIKRKFAGIKGFQAKAKQMVSKRSAIASTPTPTPTPILSPPPPPPLTPTTKVKNNARASALTAPPDGVAVDVWTDFLALRKAKRAPLSATALSSIRSEAAKAGITLQHALQVCCARGWQSYRAEWDTSTTPATLAEKARHLIFGDHDEKDVTQ